jgi:hypothetical protein
MGIVRRWRMHASSRGWRAEAAEVTEGICGAPSEREKLLGSSVGGEFLNGERQYLLLRRGDTEERRGDFLCVRTPGRRNLLNRLKLSFSPVFLRVSVSLR